MTFNPDPKKEPKPKKLPKPLRKTPLKRSKEYKIKKISDKEAARLTRYHKLRLEYLADHEICEVKGCGNIATTIHHKNSRVGENLFKYFLACCLPCHIFIEENVNWSKENGYSLNRIKNN